MKQALLHSCVVTCIWEKSSSAILMCCALDNLNDNSHLISEVARIIIYLALKYGNALQPHVNICLIVVLSSPDFCSSQLPQLNNL